MVYSVVGIDLGSAFLRGCMLQALDEGKAEIIARAEIPTPPGGFYRGNLSNIEKVQEGLERLIKELETMAGIEVEEGFVGICPPDLRGVNVTGQVTVQSKNGLVQEQDLARVQEAATAMGKPENYEVMGLIPYTYDLDGLVSPAPPLGMHGQDLILRGHMLLMPKGTLKNIQLVCSHRGIHVLSLIFEPLAGLTASVIPSLWERGALYIDIGHDTTSVVLAHRRGILHSQVFPVGGRHFTQDLMIVLGISIEEAEKIKRTQGTVLKDSVDADQAITLYSASPDKSKIVTKTHVSEILYERTEELFHLIKEGLEKRQWLEKVNTVVLGGGGALLDGMMDVARGIFDRPTELARGYDYHGLTDMVDNPSWMVALGLVRLGMERYPMLKKRRKGIFGFFQRLFGKKNKGGAL